MKNFRRKIILSWNCLLFNRVAVLKKVGLFRKNLSMKVRFWFRNVYIYLRCVILSEKLEISLVDKLEKCSNMSFENVWKNGAIFTFLVSCIFWNEFESRHLHEHHYFQTPIFSVKLTNICQIHQSSLKVFFLLLEKPLCDKVRYRVTVWELTNFSVTYIFCETIFEQFLKLVQLQGFWNLIWFYYPNHTVVCKLGVFIDFNLYS